MRRALSLLALAFLFSTTAARAQVTLGAVLTGAQETPPNNSPGSGNATVTIDASHTSVHVVIDVTKLTSAITLAHIHGNAPEGVAAGVELDLKPLTNFVNNHMDATFTVPKSFGDELVSSPTTHYVNVHTTNFGGGEIRGQLAVVGGTLIKYAADLRGANERPTPTGSGAFGSAFVTIDTATNTLTWDVNSNVTSPTLAHIHKGTSDVAGGVLVTFAGSAAAFTNGRTSGSVSIAGLSPDDLNGLITNPSAYYVNVHSTQFGAGEIRGQLHAATEFDIPIAGKVTNGRGQNFVTDLRIFNPSYDTAAAALVEYFQAGTSGNASGVASTPVNIPARGTAVLNDIAGTSGLNKPGTTGGLRVTSGESIAVTSNIFDDQRSNQKGTLGQFVTAFTSAQALRRGVIAQLAQQTDTTSGFRTNVGFFNPSSQTITVRLELRDAQGTLLGSNSIELPPFTQQQNGIAVYFPSVDFTSRPDLTLSFDASAPLFAYGSLNDNVSSDSVFVGAQPDTGVATAQ